MKQTSVFLIALLAGCQHPQTGQNAAPPPTRAYGDNNTVLMPNPPSSMGSGNTIIGAADSNGNTIITRGGTAMGVGACADQTSVAIGTNAGAGTCTRPIINAPNNRGIITQDQKGGTNIINQAPTPTCRVTVQGRGKYVVDVDSPYPAHDLYLEAVGIVPNAFGDPMQIGNGPGVLTMGQIEMGDGWGSTHVQSPYGRYVVILSAAPGTTPTLRCKVQ